MMVTQEQIEAYARQIAVKAGIPFADALEEARVDLPYQLARAARAQAAAPPAQPEAPQPRPEWEQKWDAFEAIQEANWRATSDPQRSAAKAARRAQIEGQAQKLCEQRDALNKQLAALEDEWRKNL